MRRPFVAGNWKMNGSRVRAGALVAGVCEGARALPEVDVGLCPPFVYVADAGAVIGDAPVRLGGQTCAGVGHGAFTGEVSASMLADVGCSFVLVGHSERRSLYGEDDAEIAEKAGFALAAGIVSGGLRRRDTCGARSGTDRGRGGTPARCGDRPSRSRCARRYHHCLRAGVGNRHRPDRDTGAGERGARVSERAGRGGASRTWRPGSGSSTAGASSRRMRPGCLRSPMSTADSSAARH